MINIFFFVPRWIHYNTQPWTWIYVWKWVRIFFRIKDLNTQDNLCENYFLSSIHKKWQCSRPKKQPFCATQTDSSTPSTYQKEYVRVYNTCVTLPLWYGFSFWWNWGSSVLHKTRPLKWQKMSNCTNKLSQDFAEHFHRALHLIFFYQNHQQNITRMNYIYLLRIIQMSNNYKPDFLCCLPRCFSLDESYAKKSIGFSLEQLLYN